MVKKPLLKQKFIFKSDEQGQLYVPVYKKPALNESYYMKKDKKGHLKVPNSNNDVDRDSEEEEIGKAYLNSKELDLNKECQCAA